VAVVSGVTSHVASGVTNSIKQLRRQLGVVFHKVNILLAHSICAAAYEKVICKVETS
jgi:hypothetical protein